MSQHYPLPADQTRNNLIEAARSRTPATLTYQTSGGWAMVKARFLNADDSDESLSVELAKPHECAEEPMPEIGQELGVSFRRGNRKCVFTSGLTACATHPAPAGTRTVLRLTWPDAVQELQRRLYHRTPVPSGRFIPVDLWLARAAGSNQAIPLAHRGRMLDLSAGGLSVEFPRETRPRWREDDQLACRFAATTDRPPIEVTARVTNYERRSDGNVRVGLQFMGLDTGDRGRQVLQQISGLTQRLQRSGSDRR